MYYRSNIFVGVVQAQLWIWIKNIIRNQHNQLKLQVVKELVGRIVLINDNDNNWGFIELQSWYHSAAAYAAIRNSVQLQ